MYKLWDTLKELKGLKWVDLTHQLDDNSPCWSGIPAGSVELSKTVYDWGMPQLDCLIQTFKFPGQFGTHIDFPGHFIKDGDLSEKFDVKETVYPLCVIDISESVKKDKAYAITVEDIKKYEEKYGNIPDGAFVALYSGWSKGWPSMDALSGLDDGGNGDTPGWSMEALEYLFEERNAAAVGHETLSTDSSRVSAAAGDLICERYILRKGKLQIEVMTNLDKLPPAGSILIAAYPNIIGATGLPVRAWAIME